MDPGSFTVMLSALLTARTCCQCGRQLVGAGRYVAPALVLLLLHLLLLHPALHTPAFAAAACWRCMLVLHSSHCCCCCCMLVLHAGVMVLVYCQ